MIARSRFILFRIAFVAMLWPFATPAFAQTGDLACAHGLVNKNPLFHRAAFGPGKKIPTWHLDITYVGHSTYFIETPEGASAATDYNGYHKPPYIPDIVSMNNAHESHYTDTPEPVIKHVLRGWDPMFGIARHDIKFKDMHVYNIPTNFYESNNKKTNENSIFMFEAAGLCLAHVGHLHHILTNEQAFRMGRTDVLFLPIGGFSTLSHEEAVRVIEQVKPKLILPMHYHYPGSVERFTALMSPRHPVKMLDASTMRISKKTLPKNTEVHFLRALEQGY
jgi:L-ascorbate metabolism protein UlaG (beta-lactamase superfamily)